MARSKKGATSTLVSPTEWVQTLVAEDAPRPEAPVDVSPAMPQAAHQAPVEAWPEPAELVEIPDSVPLELRDHVRVEDGRLVLVESYLDGETKRTLERSVAVGRRVRWSELRWTPSSPEGVGDVEAAVDALEWKPRYEDKSGAWVSQQAQAEARALAEVQRIAGTVTGQRLVYRTPQGFLSEVSYDREGRPGRSFLSVDGRFGAARARAALGNSRRGATLVTSELVDAIVRAHRARADG